MSSALSRVTLAATVLVLGAASAAAQEYRVKVIVEPGVTYTEESTSEQKIDLVTTLERGAQRQELKQRIESREEEVARGEVLEAGDGAIRKLRISYDKADAKRTIRDLANPDAPGQEEGGPKATTGKTYVVTAATGGKATVEPAIEDEELRRSVEKELRIVNLFPDRAVKVGDRWAVDEKAVASLFDLKPEDRGTVKCKLTGVTEVAGEPAARLAVDITLRTTQEGWVKIDALLEGEIVCSLANGRLFSAELAGPMEIQGEQSGADPKSGEAIKLKLSGTGETRLVARSKYGAAAPPPPAPPPPAGGTPGGAGAAAPPAAGGRDLSTPERSYEAMLAALKAKDYDAFLRCHTKVAQAGITRDAFDRTVKKLEEKGPPPVESFVPLEPTSALDAGTVEVRLKGGKWLTRLRKEGDSWLCDHVWAK